MRDLGNAVAVVTGAGSGIGRALAIRLHAEGCALALSDIDEAGLEAVAADLPAGAVRVTTHRLDVADREAVVAYAAQVQRDHGGAHLVVNNAGVAHADFIESMSYEDFEWVMNINFWGVVHGTKAFLPTLLEQRRGHIVNISSIFGILAVPSQSAYCASKFAVRGFTESLRQELVGTGVGVSCVHPGGVKTNIVRRGRIRRTPLGEATSQDLERYEAFFKTPAEVAADQIVRGVKRGRPRIIVGRDARFLDVLQRFMPTRYTGFLRRMAD